MTLAELFGETPAEMAEKQLALVRSIAATKGAKVHVSRTGAGEVVYVAQGSWCRDFTSLDAAERFVRAIPRMGVAR